MKLQVCDEWYYAQNSAIFTDQIFFHQSYENGVFSQFWSFDKDMYLNTWIWKPVHYGWNTSTNINSFYGIDK